MSEIISILPHSSANYLTSIGFSQGCYSQEGDIVVLCAYLGQLAKVRDALADSVAVIIDERDQQELADQEDEKSVDDDSHVEHVKVSKRVRECYLFTVVIIFTHTRFVFGPSTIIKGKKQRLEFFCLESLTPVSLFLQIVILSLVRNAGNIENNSGARPTIGFLKVSALVSEIPSN